MFNMEIQYHPGLQNRKADALSRKPEYFKEGEKNPVKTIIWNYKENDDNDEDKDLTVSILAILEVGCDDVEADKGALPFRFAEK